MLSHFPKISQVVVGGTGIQNEALFAFPEHGGLWCCWQNSIEAVEQNRKPHSMLLIVCTGVQSAWVLTRNHSRKEQLARVRAPAGVTGYTPHSLSLFKNLFPPPPILTYLHDLKVSSYVTGSLLTIDCETGQIKCQFSMWQHSAGLCFKHAWSSSCKGKKERTEDKSFEAKRAYKAVVPNLLVTKGQFHRRQYFHILGVGGGGFGKIQVHYIKFALYFCYFISSSSDHQALYPGGEGPWL